MRRGNDLAVDRMLCILEHGYRRQVRAELVPVLAAIQRAPRAKLSAGVQQVGIDDVLKNATRRSPRQISRDRLPGLAIILGHVNVRVVIVRAMGIERDVASPVCVV